MSPSDRLREAVIKTVARWHGLRVAFNHETRLAAESAAWVEWRRRRRERKEAIRAAVRAHRAQSGGVRREALRAGALVMRQQMAQAQVDKELELRDRLSQRALPQPKAHIEELEIEQ
jgi:serine phosphatase RsbU (regulator of sigma subunit)